MRKISALAASAVTAVALAVPTAGVMSAAEATTTDSATATVARAAGTKIKLSTNKKGNGTHVGLPGLIVTAKVTVNGHRAKGKVKFSVGSINLGKVKLKRGKASVQLPQTLPAATYKVKAKYKTKARKITTYVWNSSLTLNANTFTVSKNPAAPPPPSMSGTVIFKGALAHEGWVDIYKDGINTLGSQDPNYCCMTSVSSNGTFTFSGYGFLKRVAEKYPVGTYNFKAFYTDDPAFADYIYSTWITVTVTA